MRQLCIPVALACCCIALTNTDCKHNPVGPGDTTRVDTTSHVVQWMVDTLGSQGVIRDVWVFSNTDAWAVGEIYLNDSTGQPNMNVLYNAAHWDGTKWTPKRIPAYYNGQAGYGAIYSIYAFSTSDIWFSNGIHWNGSDYTTISSNINFLGIVMKTWGTSSSNFYMVGINGLIAHYNGSSWSLMTSNTTGELDDIYGTDANHIWATGYNEVTGQSVVLQYNGTNWSTLYDNQKTSASTIYGFISMWAYTNSFIYLAGGYLQTLTFSDSIIISKPITTGLTYAISSLRGVNQNDIFAVTQGGEVAHYNGVNWHCYPEVQALNNSSNGWCRVYPTSNFILIGGDYYFGYNSAPIVLRGYR